MAQSSGEIGQGTDRADCTSTYAPATAPTSDEIRADIEQTLAEMSQTIDAIQARLSPRHLVSDAKEKVKDATVGRVKRLARRSTSNGQPVDTWSAIGAMLQAATRNPISVAVVSVTAVAVLLRVLKRSRTSTHAGPIDSTAEISVDAPAKSNRIGRYQSRIVAGACVGLACWSALRARQSAATIQAPADTSLMADESVGRPFEPISPQPSKGY
jgi:Protein of unknown function (DUF3618)